MGRILTAAQVAAYERDGFVAPFRAVSAEQAARWRRAMERTTAAFDRAHKRGTWTRFKSDEELRKAVATRLPGFSFESFEILSRGVSGRVGKIRLDSTTGESLEVEGLPVRWTLDVPDTFFTARRLTPKSGPHGWQFAGRGWGHGVGLCQTGAYGMARRGHSAAAIVAHYYRGTTLETLATAASTDTAPPAR